MAEEFVDLYEVLQLPVDTDRNTLRKRVNELYLDAQRNLDHRNFATRVKFQELFEVTLPQARYILLDDGRRHEYDRIVHAFRAARDGGPPALPSDPQSSPGAPTPVFLAAPAAGGFSLEEPEKLLSVERALPIEPLPPSESDTAQLTQEREELWKKWKSGLEDALSTEGERPKSRGATTSAPTSFSIRPAPAFEVENVPATSPVTPVAPTASYPKVSTPPVRPKVDISLDFGTQEAPAPISQAVVSAGETAIYGEEGTVGVSEAEIEQRRAEHRRQLMSEVLVNVGLIWGTVGAAMIIVPALIGLIAASGHYYPRDSKALLSYPPQVLWILGILLMGVAAFFASRGLSQRMRNKKSSELALLSYEELLKQIGKS